MELVEIGYFSKTHGIKGQLLLKAYRDFEPEAVKAVFIELHGSKAPFFVSAVQPVAHGVLVSLEDVSTIEKARALLNRQVFVDATVLEEEDVEGGLLGYALHDKHFGPLGTITEVSENGAQQILHILFKERELLLPLVDEFVEEIDDEKKIIHYEAPAGLIELFLEED